jgi:hypothetical protein
MATSKGEPQSYGSQGDWASGKTGQEVSDQDTSSPPLDVRDSEGSAPHQGGDVSPVQSGENLELHGPSTPVEDEQPIAKITTTPSGAKRGGFFRQRDYE